MAGRFIAPSEQYFDNSGNVLSGGKLYFYDSGTAIAKDTYSDPDATTANANPVVLDSAGRTPDIYLDGSYKLIIKDSNDVQIEERDPVLAADDTTKGFAVWNAVTTYSVDDIVRGSNNLLYISIANSNQNFEPSATATKWSQVQLLGTYNANQSYSIGDVVIDSSGEIYRSLTNSNTGNTPSSSASNWSNTVAGAFSGDVTIDGVLKLEYNGDLWHIYHHTDNTLRFNYNGVSDDELILATDGSLTAEGGLSLPNLPTTSGATGSLYNDSGTVKVSS